MPYYNHYYVSEGNRNSIIKRVSITSHTASSYHKRYESYDHQLHQTLLEIINIRGALTSDQIKEFLRTTDDSSIIERILKWKPNLKKIFSKEPVSLLWNAVLKYCQNSAELLVRLGADVNVCYNLSILHLLVTMYPSPWNERMIVMVINQGADLQARDSDGDTPLHCAVYQGRVQVAKLMLETGADVNAVNNRGKTPLLMAAYTAQAEKLVPLLIGRGADVTHRDKKGLNALHYLAMAVPAVKEIELARLLIEKGVSLDDRVSLSQYQPIHFAVVQDKNELVQVFLDHGADANTQVDLDDGEYPLHLAAKHKDSTILQTLLKGGANIDLKTRTKGRTALHIAYENVNKLDNCKLLVSVGADMHVEDVDGKTPLALVSRESMEHSEFRPMFRTLALKKVTCPQPEIEWKDEKMIEQDYPVLWTYYRGCIVEAERMRLARFFESFTVLELLTKCHCQVAELLRNPEFRTSFCLYYLNDFREYMKDVNEAFARAESYYYSELQQENVIDEAFYNIFPYMVVRKMARYALSCEICEMKRIAHAYRRSAQQKQ